KRNAIRLLNDTRTKAGKEPVEVDPEDAEDIEEIVSNADEEAGGAPGWGNQIDEDLTEEELAEMAADPHANSPEPPHERPLSPLPGSPKWEIERLLNPNSDNLPPKNPPPNYEQSQASGSAASKAPAKTVPKPAAKPAPSTKPAAKPAPAVASASKSPVKPAAKPPVKPPVKPAPFGPNAATTKAAAPVKSETARNAASGSPAKAKGRERSNSFEIIEGHVPKKRKNADDANVDRLLGALDSPAARDAANQRHTDLLSTVMNSNQERRIRDLEAQVRQLERDRNDERERYEQERDRRQEERERRMTAEQSLRDVNQTLNLVRMFGVGVLGGNQAGTGAGGGLIGAIGLGGNQAGFGANLPAPVQQPNWSNNAFGQHQTSAKIEIFFVAATML
ncbi:hypothetical protein FRC07_002407, partial [Ceratobasidium sp. 392]